MDRRHRTRGKIETLSKWIAHGVAENPDAELVISASDRLAGKLSEKGEVYAGLKSSLLDSGAATAEEIDATLSELAKFLNRESLETKLKRELGSLSPFLASRIGYQDSIFESWSPLGFLVHISPQNAFTVGPLSILEGLLSGNVNFLKTGGMESLFPQKFVEALIQCDPTHKLKERVIVARISSKKKDLLTRIFAQADGISAWGGEESVQSVRAMAPASTRIVEWGHKISFIYVAKTSLEQPKLLERIAEEICLLEQQACRVPNACTSKPRAGMSFGISENACQPHSIGFPLKPKKQFRATARPQRSRWSPKFIAPMRSQNAVR